MTRIATLAVAALALLAIATEPALAAKGRSVLKPKLGKTVLLKPAGGTVSVKAPGKKRFNLKKKTLVPVKSRIDTTKGKVKLTSAVNSKRNQSGTFSQGEFIVTQSKSTALTDLQLTGGDFSTCTTAAKAGTRVSAAANKRRRLFGNAHGRFRTRGRNSSATVRGTQWLTEDNCNGTKVSNSSPNQTSKVETETRDLEFDLEPGQTATGYCNKFVIEPDTYCVVLLAQSADGLIAGGIITQVDVASYQFCVLAPNMQGGCTDPLPLSADDEDSFRQAVFACPVRQVGDFEFGWSIDGLQSFLFPTLILNVEKEGPNINCITDPPTETPIAKRLP